MMRIAAGRMAAASLPFVLALASCGGPTTSIQPSAASSANADPSFIASPTGAAPSSMPSVAPSPGPSETAQEPPGEDCPSRPAEGLPTVAIVPGSAVKVVVAELNLREGPCTAARKLSTLEKGQILIVWDQPYGPVSAGGYTWYPAVVFPHTEEGELPPLPASPFPDGTDNLFGWFAADDGVQPFVRPMAARCPANVDLENVVGMLPAERVACFDGQIVIEGTFGCGGCGGTGGPLGKPVWLADTFEFLNIRVSWTGDLANRPVGLHFKPSGPDVPAEGSIIRATLHVDDAVSQKCSFVWGIEDPAFTVPDYYAVAWCRERLVVDSYEILGTDADYPG